MANVNSKEAAPVLIDGQWQPASASSLFASFNPSLNQPLAEQYPVSDWSDCDRALDAAGRAAVELATIAPDQIARFLEDYAGRIEAAAAKLVEIAAAETALPSEPRLGKVELPRTTGQLRQAAAAARSGSWSMPTIDTKLNIRSCYESIGPVCVFGPNNFPFAFNSISGGDFAAAIAAGNPVIGKANTSHPGTTRALAELAQQAAEATGMPRGTVQLLYRLSHEDGARLVSDPRMGAVGYTGSRHAGLALKQAADAAGKPIYLELSSVNPVVILPGSLNERGTSMVEEFVTSSLMGTGQFCTNPGLVLLIEGENSTKFVEGVCEKYKAATPGTLLSTGVCKTLTGAIKTLVSAGAKLHCGGEPVTGRCSVGNTLLTASAVQFLADPEVFQTEAFGNATLVVTAKSVDELAAVIDSLEGNLTGCIYSATAGDDDAAYAKLAPRLARKVGRLLNDKMPTGVAVSSAMNHGGPYPSTGHPGFTAVGIPASLLRFAKLTCYDAVRAGRLPTNLRNHNPTGSTWRLIDGNWSTGDVV